MRRISIVRAIVLVVGLAAGIALGCGGGGGSCDEAACSAECAEQFDECGHAQEGTCHEGACNCHSPGSDCTNYDEGSGTGPVDPTVTGSSSDSDSGETCDPAACIAECAMNEDDCGDPLEGNCYDGACQCYPVPSDCGWDEESGDSSGSDSGSSGSGESSGSTESSGESAGSSGSSGG